MASLTRVVLAVGCWRSSSKEAWQRHRQKGWVWASPGRCGESRSWASQSRVLHKPNQDARPPTGLVHQSLERQSSSPERQSSSPESAGSPLHPCPASTPGSAPPMKRVTSELGDCWCSVYSCWIMDAGGLGPFAWILAVLPTCQNSRFY